MYWLSPPPDAVADHRGDGRWHRAVCGRRPRMAACPGRRKQPRCNASCSCMAGACNSASTASGTLPQVLALDPDLLHALRVPPSPAERQRLNLKLQRANEVTRASTLTWSATTAWRWRPATGTSRPPMSARTTATARITAGAGQGPWPLLRHRHDHRRTRLLPVAGHRRKVASGWTWW